MLCRAAMLLKTAGTASARSACSVHAVHALPPFKQITKSADLFPLIQAFELSAQPLLSILLPRLVVNLHEELVSNLLVTTM